MAQAQRSNTVQGQLGFIKDRKAGWSTRCQTPSHATSCSFSLSALDRKTWAMQHLPSSPKNSNTRITKKLFNRPGKWSLCRRFARDWNANTTSSPSELFCTEMVSDPGHCPVFRSLSTANLPGSFPKTTTLEEKASSCRFMSRSVCLPMPAKHQRFEHQFDLYMISLPFCCNKTMNYLCCDSECHQGGDMKELTHKQMQA